MRTVLVLVVLAGCVDALSVPDGAACTDDVQCRSGVCTRVEETAAGMCCDRPSDACNTCVAGHVVPVDDNTPCGIGTCFDSGMIDNHYCVQGTCVVKSINCCRGCSGVLAPGCYVNSDGMAACGCFTQAGFFCKG